MRTTTSYDGTTTTQERQLPRPDPIYLRTSMLDSGPMDHYLLGDYVMHVTREGTRIVERGQ